MGCAPWGSAFPAGLHGVTVAGGRWPVTVVERFLEGLAEEGYSSDMIKRCRALLRLAIRRAERDGKIGRNVAALADRRARRDRPRLPR